MKKLAIGSWAYLFNQEEPTTDFHLIVHQLHNLGFAGVELGAFAPHPSPASLPTRESRQNFRKMVNDHGLEFSGLIADLWSHKLVSVDDPSAYVAAFERNADFAEDLGIRTIRIDTAEPIKGLKVDPSIMIDRAVTTFDRCAKLAVGRGMNVAWEFDPAFPINQPNEILEVVQGVRDAGNGNFGVLFDTGNAHLCSRGGELELLQALKGKITHLHFSDSDGTLNEYGTGTHHPLGKGKVNFERLVPELLAADVPDDWWCIDLCYWPDAWTLTADCRRMLDKLRKKFGQDK